MITEAQRRVKKKYKASLKGLVAEARYQQSEKGRKSASRRMKGYYMEDPDKFRTRSRVGKLKKKHGLTEREWGVLFEAQGHMCAICKSTTPNRKKGGWATDHCHATGRLRQILCNRCNVVLGQCNDNIDLLKKMVVYLEYHQ